MYVDTTSAVNTPHIKLSKDQCIGQRIDYTLEWTLVIRTSPGHHMKSAAAVDLILKNG